MNTLVHSARSVAFFSCMLMLPSLANAQTGNVGIGTTSPVTRLHVADSAVVFTRNTTLLNTSANPPVSGAGVRLMWYPEKAAFRVGAVDDGTIFGIPGLCPLCPNNWNRDSIGSFSFAAGYNTKAMGEYAMALGNGATASGTLSFAAGFNTKATGNNSTALGVQSSASGISSMALGYRTIASGSYSTAIGYQSEATGYYSISLGDRSRATVDNATALGRQTIASGFYATAMGQLTNASGNSSTAMGGGSIASGSNALASGSYTVASGDFSTAMGQVSEASGHASFAAGESAASKSRGGIALGSWNDNADTPDPINATATDRIFQVGNGTSTTRSNALTLLRNGNLGIGTVSPNAPLQFANTIVNRKIVLFENVNNDHEFYGLGINGSMMRYQTAALSTDHVFYAGVNSSSSTELFRIKGDGNIGVGVSDPAFRLDVGARMRIRSVPGYTAGIWLNNDANTTSPGFMGMRMDDEIGFYGQTGTPGWRFYVNTTTGNAWLQGILTSPSDARLKTNIVPLSNTLAAISRLNGYTYHWKDNNNPEQQIGLLAQELRSVYPQLVKEENGKLGVNYIGMIPVLMEAIKEQQLQIDALQKLVLQLQEKKP